MTTEIPFNLPLLTKWQKSKMLRYAQQALTAQQLMLGANNKNILHYPLKKNRRYVRMNHYPKGDRIDHNTGAQYFYHCHRENLENNEHGHFHCFLRYKHIPKRTKPSQSQDLDQKIDNPMAHIIAIAMDRYGQPSRLFTVNRWVTDELWYDAHHVKNFIKRYKILTNNDEYWHILDQWIEAMVQLFAPQIIWLHHQRDAMITQHKLQTPDTNIYETRVIEELSEISINLQHQIQWLL